MGYGSYMGESQKTNEAAEIGPIYQAKGTPSPSSGSQSCGQKFLPNLCLPQGPSSQNTIYDKALCHLTGSDLKEQDEPG